MKRTRRLILSCLLLSLLLLTACGQRETVYQISADRLTQAATVSQLQEAVSYTHLTLPTKLEV